MGIFLHFCHQFHGNFIEALRDRHKKTTAQTLPTFLIQENDIMYERERIYCFNQSPIRVFKIGRSCSTVEPRLATTLLFNFLTFTTSLIVNYSLSQLECRSYQFCY